MLLLTLVVVVIIPLVLLCIVVVVVNVRTIVMVTALVSCCSRGFRRTLCQLRRMYSETMCEIHLSICLLYIESD